MIDAIKKVMLAGVGAAAISTEKAEKVLNELVDKGKLSASDAREAAKRISDEGKQEFDDASKSLESRFDTLLKKIGKGQNERIELLETKIAVLEVKVAELEAAASVAAKDGE